MRKSILKQMITNFEKEMDRSPDNEEYKKLKYLSVLYEKDMKYILYVEIKEMTNKNFKNYG